MKLPFVSRKKFNALMDNRIFASQLKRIQYISEDHTNKRMGNLRFTTIVKQIVDKS
jgi:hypothetical protein